MRARVHALTSRNVDHSQVCGSPKKSYLQNSVEEDEGKDQKEPTFCHLLTSKALLSGVSYGNVPFTGRRVVLPALCVQSVLDLSTASLLTHGLFFHLHLLLSCLSSLARVVCADVPVQM